MKNSAREKAENVLWWTGWRPLAVGSIGAVLGVVAGYFAGEVGPATTGVGVVLIAVAAFSPWLRRTGFVSAFVAFVVFHVVGPGPFVTSLEESGVGTGWVDFVAEFVLNIGSLVGVEPSGEPAAVVGGGVASLSLWSLAGATTGGVVWIAGVYVVNSGYADIYHRFVERVEDEGRALLDADGDDEFHTFSHGEETFPVVRSPKNYHATNLLVGDSSLSLHHGSTVDMVTREEEISNSTKELYYDQVASVDYESPFLKIRMSDGQVVKIVTSGKPVEVIDEIEDRLRRYKTSGSREDSGEGTETVNETTVGSDTNEPETSEESDALGREIVDEVDEALDAFDEAFSVDDGEDGEGGEDGDEREDKDEGEGDEETEEV